MDGTELVDVIKRTQDATQDLHARAEEILEMTQEIERLTKDTPAWYAGTRARVDARAALEQAEEPRQVLEELEERLGE